MKIAENYYKIECSRPSDIHQHLPTLKRYSELCEHITEMGVRDIVSSWAFMVAGPKKLISYDISDPPANRLGKLKEAALELNVDFKFIKANVLSIDIEPTDLLFIDTLHRGTQLQNELLLHSNKVNKYIILHDTTTFYLNGEDDNHKPSIKEDGLGWALGEFLKDNQNWVIKEVFKNNNGLTVIEKIKG